MGQVIACPILFALALSWIHEGPRASISATGDSVVVSGRGGPPNWLRSAAEYENFRLRFDFKVAQWTEAAVILRAPRAGRPMQAGIAIFLAHDFHENVTPYITGAIAGVLPPSRRLGTSYEKWHSAAIDLNGDHLTVVIDDIPVQDIQLDQHPELRHRLKRGFIGFPDLGHAYAIRNIDVEDLGSRTKFVELFDGHSLKGWKKRGDSGLWSVRALFPLGQSTEAEDGVIVGANGHSILYSEPVFQNFEFTALVRSHNRVNSGVFLRGSPDPKEHRGFEVQIYSPLDSVYPTGSIYGKQRSNISADLEERWFLLQVRVVGPTCTVRIDGQTVADYPNLSGRDLQPGSIGLQIHLEDASVEFRDLRVRPL